MVELSRDFLRNEMSLKKYRNAETAVYMWVE